LTPSWTAGSARCRPPRSLCLLMVDFALAAERNEGKNSGDSIYEACMLRLHPTLMTTMSAIVGAVPLAVGTGTGSEFRRPLGITIVGGLLVSQLLTLYTTPVVYLDEESRLAPGPGIPLAPKSEAFRMTPGAWPFVER